MAKKVKKAKKAKRPNKLMTIKLVPNEKLAAVVGKGADNRPMLTKKFWAYVKAHKLQDKKNKRAINADAKLQPLFGKKKQITMFEVGKIIKANAK